jgi:hypothetical protein
MHQKLATATSTRNRADERRADSTDMRLPCCPHGRCGRFAESLGVVYRGVAMVPSSDSWLEIWRIDAYFWTLILHAGLLVHVGEDAPAGGSECRVRKLERLRDVM